MKLIKVEYLEESSEGIFFDVMFEKKVFFTMPKIYNKRCFMEKSRVPKYPYSNYFKFCDNTGFLNFIAERENKKEYFTLISSK